MRLKNIGMASEKLYRNTLWCWMLLVWPLKNCIETPYSVGCCWIKFEFAYPQTFSLRQRAPVFSFPHLTPNPLSLNTINSPAFFISVCELDDLQRENRWSVYRLGSRELNL